jgi:anaerobic ribonucleoside-triphosphate reductase activating protein
MARDGRINVARWLERSAVNGPGERFVLWVQGCPLACPGCWNPDTWSFGPRRLLDADELAEVVLGVAGIEGITISGGEPFSQAAALLPFVEKVREVGLSVMIFTGYELEELKGRAAQELVARADILVTGRFVQEQRSLELPWRGSHNQRVVFLSSRYSEEALPPHSAAEFHLQDDGSVTVTGFPSEALLD